MDRSIPASSRSRRRARGQATGSVVGIVGVLLVVAIVAAEIFGVLADAPTIHPAAGEHGCGIGCGEPLWPVAGIVLIVAGVVALGYALYTGRAAP